MTSGAIHVAQVPESGWPCPLPPPLGCNLSTNRKRKPKWRRCVAASIAVGPSAILTGSRTRPSDWGSNARFGPVEDRRNNRRLATFTCTLCSTNCSKILYAVHDFGNPSLWQGVRVATVGDQMHSIVISHIPSRSRCGWSVWLRPLARAEFSRFGGCHLSTPPGHSSTSIVASASTSASTSD